MSSAWDPGSGTPAVRGVRDDYFAALAAADAPAALAVLGTALDRGAPNSLLIQEVVAAGQRRVGEMWLSGAWSVADEHAATGVGEQALALLACPTSPRPVGLRLAMACAEGEWHVLPARLAAELARAPEPDRMADPDRGGGLEVLELGSLPADHLRRQLSACAPDALALSCTMATNLLGAARSIAAARSEGVPVLVGGAAWGAGQHRAGALGAHLRLDDPISLRAAMDAVRTSAPAPPRPVPAQALLLDAAPPPVLTLALERHRAASTWVRDLGPHERTQFLEGLCWLARHTGAAIACDDPALLRDALAWLLSLPSGPGYRDAVVEGCYFLADAVEPDAPTGALLLRSEADQARAGPQRTSATLQD